MINARPEYYFFEFTDSDEKYLRLKYGNGDAVLETNLEMDEATKLFMDKIGNRCAEYVLKGLAES